jgi:hypothetical protein
LEKPVLNGEKMGLEFLGGGGKVIVRGEDCGVVGVGGCGGVRGVGMSAVYRRYKSGPRTLSWGNRRGLG